MKIKPKIFLLDVDGVMTNGQFLYSSKGKSFKIFGPDDHDGLSLLKPFLILTASLATLFVTKFVPRLGDS